MKENLFHLAASLGWMVGGVLLLVVGCYLFTHFSQIISTISGFLIATSLVLIIGGCVAAGIVMAIWGEKSSTYIWIVATERWLAYVFLGSIVTSFISAGFEVGQAPPKESSGGGDWST